LIRTRVPRFPLFRLALRALPVLSLLQGEAYAQPPTSAAEPDPDLANTAKFEADPLRDGSIVALGLGFTGMLQLIISTGEVRPQQVQNFDTKNLLFFDRGAVSQTLDDKAKTISNVGLYSAVAFALADPVLSGIREKSVQTALVDAILYAEALTITWGVTNLSKIAVRRPRPIAYIEANRHKDDAVAFQNQSTDSALSFFSGHASICAATTATATYLAFARSPHTARPWVTLIVGTLITGFVSYERVRAGDHFPSDVIAGALAGAGIGTLVPHFHRTETQRPVWVGFAPAGQGDGGSLTMSGFF
jgi:membrane-associated phospholipid phosphatase